MRANKVINYNSIIQVLGEVGCPFCRFSKNYQAALLQDPAEQTIKHLCSFHTWGMAATQTALSAARILLNLLDTDTTSSSSDKCDICLLLEIENDRRIREFVSCLDHREVARWLRAEPVLCLAHGSKLKRGLPLVSAHMIESIIEKRRLQLVEELSGLCKHHNPDAGKWGVLGQVAEFLSSQRGLRP